MDRTRILKKFVVSLEENPIARFEALERVNASANALGICPKLHRAHYELTDRGVLYFCLESDYFDGLTFTELTEAEKRKVAPLVRAHTKRMLSGGVWHGDLHGENILLSHDLSAVTFIENGCFDMFGPVDALALRKLTIDERNKIPSKKYRKKSIMFFL
jgi:hypothetical protein